MKMKHVIWLLLITMSEAMGQIQSLLNDLKDKDSVVICLRDYGLKEVPKEIGQLTKAITLIISPDSTKNGWTIYPPLSAFDEYIDKSPLRYLPNEITELSNLKHLTLRQLAIKELPADLDRLKNLEELDLSINKLTIKNEIDKIGNLKNLKRLMLFGNRVTKDDIIQLKKANPKLSIDMESSFEER